MPEGLIKGFICLNSFPRTLKVMCLHRSVRQLRLYCSIFFPEGFQTCFSQEIDSLVMQDLLTL